MDDDAPGAMPAPLRLALLWHVCLQLRLWIAVGVLAVGTWRPAWLTIVAAYAAVTALGFWVNVVRTCLGLKRHGGLGGRVWWSRQRPVHAALWTAAAVAAASRNRWAGVFLLADVALGIAAAANHAS